MLGAPAVTQPGQSRAEDHISQTLTHTFPVQGDPSVPEPPGMQSCASNPPLPEDRAGDAVFASQETVSESWDVE